MELDADLDAAAIAQAKSMLEVANAKKVCADPGTRTLIDAGGAMTWQYTVNSGDVFRVSVSKCK